MNRNGRNPGVRRGREAAAGRRGMTLVETLMALSILAIVSTAIVFMLQGGARVSSALGNSITNQWEVEAAICRMVQQGRMCTSLTVPSGTSGGTTFSLVTQPDAANGSATYNVTYSLVTAADGTKQLQETDPRYGTSILVRDVQSLDVRTKVAGTPVVVIVTLTVGRNPAVARTFRITPRNQ